MGAKDNGLRGLHPHTSLPTNRFALTPAKVKIILTQNLRHRIILTVLACPGLASLGTHTVQVAMCVDTFTPKFSLSHNLPAALNNVKQYDRRLIPIGFLL